MVSLFLFMVRGLLLLVIIRFFCILHIYSCTSDSFRDVYQCVFLLRLISLH